MADRRRPTSPSSAGPRPRWSGTPTSPRPSCSWRSSPTPSTPLGLTRADVDFTCLGSCDYITGQAFSFVSNLDAIGAWPPKRDSHVEMDGAWALYEAWLRLQEGDIEIAVVTGSGRSSTGDPALIYPMEMDPYFLAPLGADPLTFAALQARAVIAAGIADERIDGRGGRAVPGQRATSRPCWPRSTCASPCAGTTCRRSPTVRRPWCWPRATGPVSWSSGRPTSPASTIGPSATTRRSGPSTTRRRPGSPPRRPVSATARSRWPSCRPPSPTRSCCCARCSTWATTWP